MLGVQTTRLSLWGLRGGKRKHGGRGVGPGRTRSECSWHSDATLSSCSQPRQLTSPDGSSGGPVTPPGQPGHCHRAVAAPHRPPGSCTHCFSKLIPHARLMNNVI